MAVGAGQKNRISRCHAVEIVPGRKAFRRPVLLDPAPADDPLTGLLSLDLSRHFLQEIFERAAAIQVEIVRPFTDPKKMVVGIGQAGHDGSALQVDDLCLRADPA